MVVGAKNGLPRGSGGVLAWPALPRGRWEELFEGKIVIGVVLRRFAYGPNVVAVEKKL